MKGRFVFASFSTDELERVKSDIEALPIKVIMNPDADTGNLSYLVASDPGLPKHVLVIPLHHPELGHIARFHHYSEDLVLRTQDLPPSSPPLPSDFERLKFRDKVYVLYYRSKNALPDAQRGR